MSSVIRGLATVAKTLIPVIGASAVAYLVYMAYVPYGIGWNTTNSIPFGLYLTKEVSETDNLTYGDIVCFRYAEPPWAIGRDYAPRGIRICKPIVGLAGDSLAPTSKILRIDRKGALAPMTVPLLSVDSKGRVMYPAITTVSSVPPESVFLISATHVSSFDSRYLGPIPRSHVTHKIYPILVTER